MINPPEFVRFATEHAKKWTLDTIDVRVPIHNDLYINKDGFLQRCKSTHHSNRSQKRIIVKETWFGRQDV